MAVYADVSHDARVQREAAALAMAGYRVTVLSLPGGEVPDLGSRIDCGHSSRDGVKFGQAPRARMRHLAPPIPPLDGSAGSSRTLPI